MTTNTNLARLKSFLASQGTQHLFGELRDLGCTIDNLDDIKHSPVYINLPVNGTDSKPFIGIFEVEQMQNGNNTVWVGVDDGDSCDGLKFERNKAGLCHALSEKLGLKLNSAITAFSVLAIDMMERADAF